MTDRSNYNKLYYKGYTASVFFTEEDGVFFGKVEGIRDSISFEGESVQLLLQDFHDAIDEYLEFCENEGKEPQKPPESKDISPEELYNIICAYANQKKMAMGTYMEHFAKFAESRAK